MTNQAELISRKEIKPQSNTNLPSSCHVPGEKEQATQQRERIKQIPLGKAKRTAQEREPIVFLMISWDLTPSLGYLPFLGFHKIIHKFPTKSILNFFFFT